MNYPNRLPAIDESQWDVLQKEQAEEMISGPRGQLLPPFEPLLRSPNMMKHVQRLGEYLRYSSAIGSRLTELAILMTARHWNQAVEWSIHAPLAIAQGINPVDVECINQKIMPTSLQPDEKVIYQFCTELHQNKEIHDTTWQSTVNLFGEKGVIDLIGINGYYTFLSMVMNSAQTPAPETGFQLML
ncbi:carboxymuconolactone decarboxylase family protein [Acinetobacter sp. B5B]|uniref:carboxymuconolactone decarboxylase family protein n=1 Tax=Acinetobacter baretiae TaxID=2605383 RepID=UPI0018C2BEF2|nr:carboxymuconolactone decarboxylase family protein [Acinetobacter baretiae]MBF7682592.1 carboxymuconolactone decarboxylase family protein [Acinetobacter baretiae]MBF7685576.1 carboxymuconolactone decarboxylase family protein [Acinetobacter baretiae]